MFSGLFFKRESYKLNCDCARAIEKAIEAHYHDNRLADNAAEDVLAKYGFNRVNYVLANTIREKNEDGRFSDENKAWAKSIYVSKNDTNMKKYAVPDVITEDEVKRTMDFSISFWGSN